MTANTGWSGRSRAQIRSTGQGVSDDKAGTIADYVKEYIASHVHTRYTPRSAAAWGDEYEVDVTVNRQEQPNVLEITGSCEAVAEAKRIRDWSRNPHDLVGNNLLSFTALNEHMTTLGLNPEFDMADHANNFVRIRVPLKPDTESKLEDLAGKLAETAAVCKGKWLAHERPGPVFAQTAGAAIG